MEPWLIPEQEWVMFLVEARAGSEVDLSREFEDGVDYMQHGYRYGTRHHFSAQHCFSSTTCLVGR